LLSLAREAGHHLGAEPTELTPVLATLLGDRRFRSTYVVDLDGRVVVRSGADPLRTPGRLAPGNGVDLDRSSRRVPAIYARAWFSQRYGLVAEFDVNYLRSVLRRLGGRLRVVDGQMRTILDTDGYIPYEKLPAGPLSDVAMQAFDAPTHGDIITISGVRSLVNASEVNWRESPDSLRLMVLAQRPVSALTLSGNDERRSAWLLAVIGAAVALLMLVWHQFLVVRPLRTLAAAADRFRSGDARTVISPSRLDEIGAIAICLDICRQAHVDGAGRLGGVVRMRGAGSDHTAVISRIPAERPASTPEPNESTGHATAALVDNKNAPQARHPYFERS